ncbi:MAG: hypothetical protein ACLP9Y_32110 [Mycobacterium sp.]
MSRAINAYTHELATLTEQGSRAAKMPETEQREDALLAISEKLGTLRDAAQHHLLELSEGQLYVHAQSGITLFRD